MRLATNPYSSNGAVLCLRCIQLVDGFIYRTKHTPPFLFTLSVLVEHTINPRHNETCRTEPEAPVTSEVRVVKMRRDQLCAPNVFTPASTLLPAARSAAGLTTSTSSPAFGYRLSFPEGRQFHYRHHQRLVSAVRLPWGPLQP